MEKKDLYILGAAGSIGMQTLEVIKNDHNFNLIGITLSSKDYKNYLILDNFKPRYAVLRNKNKLNEYKNKYPNITFYYGDKGIKRLINKTRKGDILVNALSGTSGLIPTIEAIKKRLVICQANKESIVIAGNIINKYLKKYNLRLYPIDSEHNALFNLLEKHKNAKINEVIITASGGSLRDYKRSELKNVTKNEVLNHPTWKMGPKITVDSATMLNKGFEVIEAHYLFGFPYEKIKVYLDRKSNIHALIKLSNNKIIPFYAKNDMKEVIKNALYQGKYSYELNNNINFKLNPIDYDRYPLLELSYKIGKKDGLIKTVLVSASEALVKLFLNDKIPFIKIEEEIFKIVKNFKNKQNPSLRKILKTNKQIYNKIIKKYDK